MSFDPILDPFRTGLGGSTADLFKRPRGGVVRRPMPAEAAGGPESEPEPQTAPAEEKPEEQEKVILRNPRWEVEGVGFNEETDISVEAVLPESQAKKTKVAFELFAKTPEGPERIGSAEGTIRDGKALCRIPVYIPQYRDEAGELLAEVEYWFTAKHAASDPLEDDTVVKKVVRMAEVMIESHVLDGIAFYDKLVVESAAPPPPPLPPPEEGIVELAWEKPSLVAWDAEDKPEMRTLVKVKTLNLPPCDDAVLEILQYSADGKHAPYRKIEGLKLDGDALLGPDGNPLEIRIEWHDAIYGYGKTQYFLKLIAGGKEKESGQTRDTLLQLKHCNGTIADPSGDLKFARQEGIWVATHMRSKGPWLEATTHELVTDGHPTRLFHAVGNGTMKTLLERNKFIHHQSSHGTAYCWCDGNRNFFEDTGVAGTDGSIDWACPVCNKSSGGVGVIINKDLSNLFYRGEVKKLARSPKVLVFANCCLTAVTSAYAKAWLAKGTRWYIGWAIPVDDEPAVEFAKAFYRRWFGRYKLDPDKVKHAWSDVKGPYQAFRPRIFGS